MTTTYVPGTLESDTKKIVMSLQQIGPRLDTANANITTNTSAIATLNAATYVNSIAGRTGVITLSTGITNSANDIRLSLTNTSFMATPANPTGTSNNTGVMMGLGTSCKITPTYSGRVLINFTSYFATSGVGTGGQSRIYFGTGTAPANGAAITGTQIGQSIAFTVAAGNTVPVSNGGIITGLTPGTAYWFDQVINPNSAVTLNSTAITSWGMEF